MKLEALREVLKKRGLDGFIIPRMDKYQGEFVSAGAERLAWLTGFTGSAGIAVVLQDRAVVVTDGRYTIQLRDQVDKTIYHAEDIAKKSAAKWIKENSEEGDVIGYDPWLHTPEQVARFEESLGGFVKLQAVEDNPVDEVWIEKPSLSYGKIEIFPDSIAGAPVVRKKDNLVRAIAQKNLFGVVISMPDSLMWLLNVRGNDIEHTPVSLSFGIVYADGRALQLFTNAKISAEVQKHLGDAVEVINPDRIGDYIDRLGAEAKKAGKAVALDYARASEWFKKKLEKTGASISNLKDPCILTRAIKTEPEQAAILEAHRKDGAAIVKFLTWFEAEAPKGKLTEMEVVERLENFRKLDPTYKGPSFATIAGFGPNGAIVHYRATPETNKKIETGNLLLLDSGGQYHWGTTDITRTLSIGEVPDEMRMHYTLVLKAHIAVAAAKFPAGTTGAQIDALARKPLWDAGLDYAHGTGHGVGCYLSVHEESASLSVRGHEPLQAGMLLSNEPGYYREGAYGIRTENLVFVRGTGITTDQGQAMLGFETVTRAPFDRSLIVKEMLSREEIHWVNDYQALVLQELAPQLDPQAAAWLERQVKPL